MFYFGHWNIYDTYVIVLLFTKCYVTFTLDIFFLLLVSVKQISWYIFFLAFSVFNVCTFQLRLVPSVFKTVSS